MKFSFGKIISRFLAFIMAISFPAGAWQVGGHDSCFYKWDEQSVYSSEEYALEMEKDPDRDFVVLNIADVQLFSINAVLLSGKISEKMIDRLVEDVKPDLITLSGDNAWGATAYLKLIEKVDSYGIPWAPVMGNHDGDFLVSEFWCAYKMYEAENCIFEFGPENMGYGNYIINITENGKTVHTVFLMDTHASTDLKYGEGLTERQLQWYKWAVKGIEKENGKIVESSVIMHIPTKEFEYAWESVHDENGNLIEPYASAQFCHCLESVSCPDRNVGFFDLCKELESTKNIIVGHDHVNCFSIEYEGITLTYSLKLGLGGYCNTKLNGGTILKIDSNGNMKTEFLYVDPMTVLK
ncbi:MAG: metallophosphoesterase [Clostridia bacterium]|nr:metallophosphoesterase [Clostridia bacterium]